MNEEYLEFVMDTVKKSGFDHRNDERMALLWFAGYIPTLHEDWSISISWYAYFANLVEGVNKPTGFELNDESRPETYRDQYTDMFTRGNPPLIEHHLNPPQYSEPTVPEYAPQFASAVWLSERKDKLYIESYIGLALVYRGFLVMKGTIQGELMKKKKKTEHFAWYFWPGSTQGQSDKLQIDGISAKAHLTDATRDAFFTFLPYGFRELHEKYVKKQKDLPDWTPAGDWGRIKAFRDAVVGYNGWDFYNGLNTSSWV